MPTYLNWLDKCVRSAIRTWLKLPNDSPTAFLHSKVKNGGLGVQLLAQTIPLMRSKRISRLSNSDDPAINAMIRYSTNDCVYWKQLEPQSYKNHIINTHGVLESALAEDLYQSVDGRCLGPSQLVPKQHHWVREPPLSTSGRSYIDAIHIRGNPLNTTLRASRGRPSTFIACNACGRPESLGHIL